VISLFFFSFHVFIMCIYGLGFCAFYVLCGFEFLLCVCVCVCFEFCVWSSRRRGQEQHEKEEGDKEAKQLENNLKKRETKRTRPT